MAVMGRRLKYIARFKPSHEGKFPLNDSFSHVNVMGFKIPLFF